jgi:hypothetical protein
VVKQVERSAIAIEQQAQTATNNTRSLWIGVKVAWQSWRDHK